MSSTFRESSYWAFKYLFSLCPFLSSSYSSSPIFSIPSLSFSSSLFPSLMTYIYIKYLLCADTKDLALSHPIKTIQNIHACTHACTHSPFLDLTLSFGYHLISLLSLSFYLHALYAIYFIAIHFSSSASFGLTFVLRSLVFWLGSILFHFGRSALHMLGLLSLGCYDQDVCGFPEGFVHLIFVKWQRIYF